MTQDPRDYEIEHAAGGMSRWAYLDDPKRLAFTAARYKHVAKMLEGKERVLEVGCSDGFYSRIVRQHVGYLTAIDTDERSIAEAEANSCQEWHIRFEVGDVTDLIVADNGKKVQLIEGGLVPEAVPSWEGFDAVYSLDVLEHIRHDHDFLYAMRGAAPVAVIGTPSLESQAYASPRSTEGHVNCYSGPDLKKRLEEFWDNVFLFTMHDETLGTSYASMSQYLLALCVR